MLKQPDARGRHAHEVGEGYVVRGNVDQVCGRHSVDHNNRTIDGGHMERRDLGEEMDVWRLLGRKGDLYPPRWRPAASTHSTVPATHLARRVRACRPHGEQDSKAARVSTASRLAHCTATTQHVSKGVCGVRRASSPSDPACVRVLKRVLLAIDSRDRRRVRSLRRNWRLRSVRH